MITVYEIPLADWLRRESEPTQEVLDNARVIAQEDNPMDVLKQLIAAVNEETVDDINCYLYLKEEL